MSADEAPLKVVFHTYEHPSEGLLVRPTLCVGEDDLVQDWRRCRVGEPQHETRAPASVAAEFLPSAEVADLGPVEEPPALRVGVVLEETAGEVEDDGISIAFGGACPVQGEGRVDGFEFYYRARGSSWSIEISDGSDEEFFFGEHGIYIWPDGGWISAAESERNIRLGVAKWRESRAGRAR